MSYGSQWSAYWLVRKIARLLVFNCNCSKTYLKVPHSSGDCYFTWLGIMLQQDCYLSHVALTCGTKEVYLAATKVMYLWVYAYDCVRNARDLLHLLIAILPAITISRAFCESLFVPWLTPPAGFFSVIRLTVCPWSFYDASIACAIAAFFQKCKDLVADWQRRQSSL